MDGCEAYAGAVPVSMIWPESLSVGCSGCYWTLPWLEKFAPGQPEFLHRKGTFQ